MGKWPPRALIAPGIRETSRQLTGMSAENGTKIHFIQHGGRYGETIATPREYYERSVSDCFVSWGWEDTRVLALPSAKLDRIRKRYGKNYAGTREDNKHILWCAEQYSLVGDSPPFESPVTYRRRQMEFVNRLPSDLRPLIHVRLRPPKAQMDESTGYEWLRTFNLSTTDSSKHIVRDFRRAGLVLIDQPFTTTFLEVLALEKPVIVYSPEAKYYTRNTVSSAYRLLHEAGIVCETVEDVFLAMRQHLLGCWWDHPGRREALQFASHLLARTSRSKSSVRFAELIR